MKETEDKKIPIKINLLKKIYASLLPAYYRLYNLSEDIQSGAFTPSEIDKSILYESLACSLSLKVLFEEYFDQANEAQTDTLYLPTFEFQSLLSLSKVVESSYRTPIHGVGIWDH